MAEVAAVRPPFFSLDRVRAGLAHLRPAWSSAAAFRAVRALLVIPSLFAIGTQVLDNSQLALFATFGGFAAVIMSNFGGTRRDKLIAHLALAVAGTALIPIGTAINSSAALASPIALLVVFVVILVGVLGSNATSGTTAVLLAFILPAASPGAISLVPSRLAGRWLAMAAGTIVELVLSPRPTGDRLRANAAGALEAVAATIDALGSRQVFEADMRHSRQTRDDLVEAFRRAPSRPIGIGAADQAIADLAETVQWAVSLVDEVALEEGDLTELDATDCRLLATSSTVLSGASRLLSGVGAELPIAELEKLMTDRDESMCTYCESKEVTERSIHLSFHARMIASAARTAGLDALTVARRGPRRLIAEGEARGAYISSEPTPSGRSAAYLSSLLAVLRIHSGLASVTFLNAVRGAIAIAAAVAIADLTNVQHGFWVVLGALTVLRTNAASTGVNAWRALLGTAIGFAIGAALLVGVGGSTDVLWAIFPIGVAVAAYAPGTAPFAVAQAGFTVVLVVVYNLIAPVGWKIGVVRIEDVAIGVAVSIVAGVLFWPRGASGVVRDDLADAFHYDGLFLVQSTAWALGRRTAPPDAGEKAARSDVRLGDAARALMVEQGVRHVPKEQAWRLVSAVGRVRSAARSLAVELRHDEVDDEVSSPLLAQAVHLAGVCDDYSSRIANRPATVAQELAGLAFIAPNMQRPETGYGRWVREHLDNVGHELDLLVEPVDRVAATRNVPWWR